MRGYKTFRKFHFFMLLNRSLEFNCKIFPSPNHFLFFLQEMMTGMSTRRMKGDNLEQGDPPQAIVNPLYENMKNTKVRLSFQMFAQTMK